MSEILDAIFEKGVFKPLQAPNLAEGQYVRLVVERQPESPDGLLELAGRVYEGLSAEEIEEVERIALDRTHFFSR